MSFMSVAGGVQPPYDWVRHDGRFSYRGVRFRPKGEGFFHFSCPPSPPPDSKYLAMYFPFAGTEYGEKMNGERVDPGWRFAFQLRRCRWLSAFLSALCLVLYALGFGTENRVAHHPPSTGITFHFVAVRSLRWSDTSASGQQCRPRSCW